MLSFVVAAAIQALAAPDRTPNLSFIFYIIVECLNFAINSSLLMTIKKAKSSSTILGTGKAANKDMHASESAPNNKMDQNVANLPEVCFFVCFFVVLFVLYVRLFVCLFVCFFSTNGFLLGTRS